MATLFELGQELLELHRQMTDAADSNAELTPEVAQHLDQWFASIADAEAVKLDNYVNFIRQLEAEAAAAKLEAERYAQMAEIRESAVKRLKEAMVRHLDETGRTEAKTASNRKICIQKNGGKAPLRIEDGMDLAKLPPVYIKIVRSVNTDAVRQALNAGEQLEWAKLGDVGRHLRIR